MNQLLNDIKRNKEISIVIIAAALCVLVRYPVGICVILALCAAALLAVSFIERRQRKRRLTALTEYLCAVQDHLTLPPIETDQEDEFGILQSEVYKVVALLREQYAAEKRQKLYLSDMLSNISHQIKTPLTAVSLMTELLEQPSLSDEQRLAYAGKIDRQVTRITWLIRHLLTLSQLEAGVLEMKREEISLISLMEQVRESLGVMAELKGVEILLDIPSDMTMKGDRHWLCEAMMNIVKNGIEHNRSGGYVRIRAEQTPIFLRLTVEDNGVGIDENDLPHIFERFYKAKNAPPQSIGIGLALARQIIALHNGKIDVHSIKEQGSVFTVKFYCV